MVKIKASKWLRASDVRDGDIVVIVSEGQNRSAEETPFQRPVFEIDVKLPSGEVRTWTMNTTTQRRCAEAFGDETGNWVNKKVKIQLREQNVRGVMKTVVYGVPIREELQVFESKPETPPEEETVTVALTREELKRLKELLGRK
ncbi:MAG: hypothetical protein QXT26_02395 [Thermoproteota archaeon]